MQKESKIMTEILKNIVYIPLEDGRYAVVKSNNIIIGPQKIVVQLQNGKQVAVNPQVSELGDKMVVIRIQNGEHYALKYSKIIEDLPRGENPTSCKGKLKK
jgi:hypothetical protein